MGWTLSGLVQFLFKDKLTPVSADGNNAAWVCPCGGPVLFVYQKSRPGSAAAKPAHCGKCGAEYYLDPGYGSTAEPPAGMPVPPAPVMRIIKK